MVSLTRSALKSGRFVVAILAATLVATMNADGAFADVKQHPAPSAPAAQERLELTSTANATLAAVSPDTVCDPKQLCLYADLDGSGAAQILTPQPAGTCIDIQSSLKGTISSITNRTDQLINLFPGDGCTGAADFVDGGVGYPNLRIQGFDNQLRSVRFDPIRFPTDPCVEPSQYLCLFTDPGFSGDYQVVSLRAADACVDLLPEYQGQTSSVRNNMIAQQVALFAGTGCTGSSTTIEGSSNNADLGRVGLDNQIRSVKFLPRTGLCGSAVQGLCLFTGTRYSGAVQVFPLQAANSCVDITSVPLSVRNQLSNQTVVLFQGARCTGRAYPVAPGRTVADLTTPSVNIQTKSVQFRAPVSDPCPDAERQLCLFANTAFTGERLTIPAAPVNTCVNLPAAFQDTTSSLNNRTRLDVTFYDGANCTGASDWVYYEGIVYDLASWNFDNKIKSIKFTY
uniref:peptidase inhibitor family I36 protein n=1 Tax=Paractinoplanes polyasparticus TaxID=2856853 RepID=UPI001C853BB4|nr:peptidase inhibitor family I36 protein [Actinoplanes polyasparticus]